MLLRLAEVSANSNDKGSGGEGVNPSKHTDNLGCRPEGRTRRIDFTLDLTMLLSDIEGRHRQ